MYIIQTSGRYVFINTIAFKSNRLNIKEFLTFSKHIRYKKNNKKNNNFNINQMAIVNENRNFTYDFGTFQINNTNPSVTKI